MAGASAAAAFAEKLDLAPAFGTKSVDIRNDRPAAGATRRKREIERPPRDGSDRPE
jgi:hypothetical protein